MKQCTILFFHRWTGVRGGGTESHIKGLLSNFSRKHKTILLTRSGKKVAELRNTFKETQIITVSRNITENDHSYENPLFLYIHTSIFMIKSIIYLLYRYYLQQQKIDLISVHFATEAIVARIFRFLTNVPYIFILEGYTDWEAIEAQHANKVISISHYISKKCQKNFGFYPPVIYIGEDTIPYLSPSHIIHKQHKRMINVLTVCRIEPRKNIVTLLKAIQHLQNQGTLQPYMHFNICGTGIDETAIRLKIKELKIKKNVTFYGYVSNTKLFEKYRNAQIFCLPSLEEGFGIVLIEAMKSGCVIIANNTSAIPEIVSDSGLLLEDPTDYKKLAKALYRLTNEPELRVQFALNARKRAQQFNWKFLYPQYEKIYLSALTA